MVPLYPIFVNLAQKKCLVVGGGQVALRKVVTLLEHEAEVWVVSPESCAGIMSLAESNQITLIPRRFMRDDLQHVNLVIAATNDQVLNRTIALYCKSLNIMLNSVDDPGNCDFFVPAVLRRKSLVIAISTEGKSPLFAKRLKEDLSKTITPDYGDMVDFLGEKRDLIKAMPIDQEKKSELLSEIISDQIFEMLRNGEEKLVRERIEKCISSWLD